MRHPTGGFNDTWGLIYLHLAAANGFVGFKAQQRNHFPPRLEPGCNSSGWLETVVVPPAVAPLLDLQGKHFFLQLLLAWSCLWGLNPGWAGGGGGQGVVENQMFLGKVTFLFSI